MIFIKSAKYAYTVQTILTSYVLLTLPLSTHRYTCATRKLIFTFLSSHPSLLPSPSFSCPCPEFIVTLLTGLKTPAWIGLNDRRNRNTFEWVDNLQVDYTHWGWKQPDENINDQGPDARVSGCKSSYRKYYLVDIRMTSSYRLIRSPL